MKLNFIFMRAFIYNRDLNQIFLRCWAFPTPQEAKTALIQIDPKFELPLLGNMLLAYDACKYSPNFSPVIEAITKLPVI